MKKKTTSKKKTVTKAKTRKSLEGKKNIILFVGLPPVGEDMRNFKKTHKQYRLAFLYQADGGLKNKRKQFEEIFDIVLTCDFSSSRSIIATLAPYHHELAAVTCRAESKIMQFAKLIPYIPYLRTPTSESLEWSVNKIKMRSRFKAYNKKITPKYHIVKDATNKTRMVLEEKVGFPLVIKPAGLAQSLLVTVCYHQEELEKELKKTFRTIKALYAERGKQEELDEPKVLVEELMDGDMYSVDGHVTSRGKMYFYEPVHVTTGRAIGFDDFFGYKQITPTRLSRSSISEMQHVTTEGVRALGLRSTTFHAELMKTEEGWKIIEIGPRVGGFRQKLYKLSYNNDITENDIAIRLPKKPNIKKKVYGHTAAMKFFAKNEGIITTLKGTKKARELKSFHSIQVNKKVGDKARFAKNGGKSVFNITLFNKDRSKLLADIRRLEKMVDIKTKRS